MREELYAIAVKRDKQDDYFFPMPLKQIDECFMKYKKEQVLALMRQNDSVLIETDPDRLTIKKLINGNLIEDKNTPIIEDEYILTFKIEDLPLDSKKGEKFANILYNRLEPYKTKNVSDQFKETIDLLKIDKETFINHFKILTYAEQRLIRVIIMKNMNIKEYLKENTICLQRVKENQGDDGD